jgi:hypothetical protein
VPSHDSFSACLRLPTDDLTWDLAWGDVLPSDAVSYYINPRRLRGSDFLMRWAQGRWSEDIVVRSLNQTDRYRVLPFGPSTVAPDDPRELEAFFERMDAISIEGKRPDLLLYARDTFQWAVQLLAERLGRAEIVPEIPASQIDDVIRRARAALEIENSLWVTEKMPGFGKPFSRYTRGARKGQLKPAGIVPTIIVKEEDIPRLRQWEADYGVPLYVVHIFFDRGYFVRFRDILAMLEAGDVGFEAQRFTNPDGTAAASKNVVKVPYVLCKEFGTVSGPTLVPRTFVDRNGKVMTYVTFQGGTISLSPSVFQEWAD